MSHVRRPCLNRLWPWLVALCLWLLAGSLCAAPLELTKASALVEVDGVQQRAPVTLPYPWDRFQRGHAGRAAFTLHFDLPAAPVEPWALYLPRVGNAYEIWLNGQLLERRGNMAHFNGADYGLVPRYMNVPVGYLAAQNRLEVHIRADVGRRGGLSRMVLGPMDEVYQIYLREYRLRSMGAVLVVGFSLLVGLVSLSLWATQTRGDGAGGAPQREPLYLFAGLAELFWTVRVSHTQIEVPPLDWPWWGIFPVVALGAWGAFMTYFCLELAGVSRHSVTGWLFRRWLAVLMLLGPVVGVVALGFGHALVLTVWYAALGLSFLGFGVWFIAHAVRTPSLTQRVVAATVVINVLAGLRDLYVFRIEPAYPSNALMYYTSMLFGLTLGYVVLGRFRDVSTQARELMNAMTVRIAARERELNSSYQRLEVLAREQERTHERARILRDMHDGVGSHISAAIRQLQSGRARPEDVLQTLRESLDQLKLTIDAMHLPPGDITALLANLRYRLEPRMQASDVELQWAVDLIEPIRRLDAQAMRHLQFMVFEALSNVLQHAQANWLRIEAAMTSEGARLRIVDNGRGFDVMAPPRKGLVSLRERAAAIGAHLHIDSAPGRTVVDILVPVT